MSKNRRKIDPHRPTNRVSGPSAGVQRNLFEYIRQERSRVDRTTNHQEGTLGIGEKLRLALNEAIKKSPLSRHQIAGEMSHLLGCEVTKTTMDTWTAESKAANRIPAEYLPAFCQTTKSRRPLEILNEAAGLFSMPGPDALRSEIQKYDEMERKARALSPGTGTDPPFIARSDYSWLNAKTPYSKRPRRRQTHRQQLSIRIHNP